MIGAFFRQSQFPERWIYQEKLLAVYNKKKQNNPQVLQDPNFDPWSELPESWYIHIYHSILTFVFWIYVFFCVALFFFSNKKKPKKERKKEKKKRYAKKKKKIKIKIKKNNDLKFF